MFILTKLQFTMKEIINIQVITLQKCMIVKKIGILCMITIELILKILIMLTLIKASVPISIRDKIRMPRTL
jgi:hypothetical protein